MNKNWNYLGLTLSIVFVFLLSAPFAQYLFRVFPDGGLYGYVEKRSTKPENFFISWTHKDFQQWWTETFDRDAGFRSLLVRSFNEITFRFFSEEPRVRLYSTPAHGLYSQMSIDSLNYEVIHRDELTKNYMHFAQSVYRLQQHFEKNSKSFIVVIGSSKPYVHPDSLGSRFLVDPSENVFSKMASLGDELKKQGVNVIDSGPLLRQFYKDTSIDTHPYSGVHWNYYSGCLIARELMRQAKRVLFDAPALSCGDPVYQDATMIDVDGLLLLNVLSNVNLKRPTPYPSPTAALSNDYRPKILIVGDSFMDQMVYSLERADSYSRLAISSYFRTREIRERSPASRGNTEHVSDNEVLLSVKDDALNSDLVILEMVDYNVSRLGYGFVEYVLNDLASNASGREQFKILSTSGGYDIERDGDRWWHWVAHRIDFVVKSIFLPDDVLNTHVHFEFGTRSKRALKLIFTDVSGKQREVSLQGDGVSRQQYDGIVDIPPQALVRVSLESDAEPGVLGKNDPRRASFIVANLVVSGSKLN